jgi:hypothetical protein
VLARWVLVGLATGTALHFTAVTSGPLWPGLDSVPATLAAAGAVAVVGALVGAGLSRFAAVPWDGLGLAAIAIAVVLRSPQGRQEFVERGTDIRVLVVFLLGLVLAASLTSLGMQASLLRDIGGAGEAAALVGLGFAAAILAATVIFPASLLANQYGETGLIPAISVGIATVGVFALYGLGRLARSVRRAIEAEARREVT